MHERLGVSQLINDAHRDLNEALRRQQDSANNIIDCLRNDFNDRAERFINEAALQNTIRRSQREKMQQQQQQQQMMIERLLHENQALKAKQREADGFLELANQQQARAAMSSKEVRRSPARLL